MTDEQGNEIKKILTICHEGHCRSVATASFLKTRGYDAIALGLNKNSKETFDMLGDWADVVLVADQPHMMHRLPDKIKEKVDKRFHIGEDEWGSPSSFELWNLIERQLDGFKDYPHVRRNDIY